jgi:hypothetical protein
MARGLHSVPSGQPTSAAQAAAICLDSLLSTGNMTSVPMLRPLQRSLGSRAGLLEAPVVLSANMSLNLLAASTGMVAAEYVAINSTAESLAAIAEAAAFELEQALRTLPDYSSSFGVRAQPRFHAMYADIHKLGAYAADATA